MTNKTDHATHRMFDYVYNANGWTTSRTDGKNRQTQYGYNAMGSVTNVVYPGSSNVYAYNAMQQLTNMVDLTGTNRFTYENGFLIEEDGPWASDAIHLGYMHGVRTNLTLSRPSGGDWTQTYTYDPTLRLTALASGAGTLTYSFRGAGDLITNLALPNGATITNSYDSAARWTGTYLKNSAGTILNYHSYVYNTGNQRTKQTRIDGSYVDYGYDSIGQVVSGIGKETNGTARLNEKYLYAYDAAGNLNYRTNNDLPQTFTVDNLNQLSTVARNSTMTVAGIAGSTATNITIADNGNSPVTAILYNDKSFARTNVTILSGSNVFTAVGADSLGRSDTNSVTLNLPTSVSYTYDDNGNLTADGQRTFVYDDENQLTMVTVTNGTGSSTCSAFVYDGKNRRRVRLESNWVSSAWVKTAEIRYVYDGNLVIQERDANNVPTVTYTRGTDLSGSLEAAGGIGGLLARTDHSGGAPSHAYYHADANGNVTVLISSSQIIVARYIYDSFGNTLAKIGPLAVANLYRFSSKKAHSGSGLIYYRYRYYDSNLQHWLNRDPIEETGGANLYSFLGNSPTFGWDAFGLHKGDPTHGLPADFWNWYHRSRYYKATGKDLNKEEALRLYADEYKPGVEDGNLQRGDKRRKPQRGGGRTGMSGAGAGGGAAGLALLIWAFEMTAEAVEGVGPTANLVKNASDYASHSASGDTTMRDLDAISIAIDTLTLTGDSASAMYVWSKLVD